MSFEDNKALVRRWLEEAVSDGNVALVAVLWTGDAVPRATEFLIEFGRALPDGKLHAADLVKFAFTHMCTSVDQ